MTKKNQKTTKTTLNPDALWPFPAKSRTTKARSPKKAGAASAPDLVIDEANDATSTRNPAWTRDELILALDLYLHHRTSPPGPHTKEVKELSELLNNLGHVLGLGNIAKYRNPNGVYMKLMNFRRFDPQYTNDGKVGLRRGNKDEEHVWAEFANDNKRRDLVVRAIQSVVAKHSDDAMLAGADELNIEEAEEGRLLTRLHRFRERNRGLVEAAKKAAIKKHGRLFCEACGFDFAKKYGEAGVGIIEVHHTRPVHTLSDGDKTKLSDLILLCANCHRVVHSSRRWLTLDQVKAAISD